MPLLEEIADLGFSTGLPVTPATPRALTFRRWIPGRALREGLFGIMEPLATAALFKPSVLLIPVVAFDAKGYRLGFGRGFYDRTLEALRAERPILAIGIAYSGQEVDEVVPEPHDQKLDWVVTEAGARAFE